MLDFLDIFIFQCLKGFEILKQLFEISQLGIYQFLGIFEHNEYQDCRINIKNTRNVLYRELLF